MENINQKLEFLIRAITDSLSDRVLLDDFFKNQKYPLDGQLLEIMSTPVPNERLYGLDWPERAHTMIGIKRMKNLMECLDYIRENKIEGDFIETGVWRGGASIFMKKYSDLYKLDKKVFVADSFEGLPHPDISKYPQDLGDTHYTMDFLKVSLDEVTDNFRKYDCLDNRVIFLKGWFKDTLQENNDINKISILRFDGDMYGSTMDVLNNLYDKVTVGGVIIIDDYCLSNCVKAVTDFRESRSIDSPLKFVDQCGVYWTKQ
jgi:hypothetical protein